MYSLHQDLSGSNISFDHMTLIVTFDLLSKNFNMAPKFFNVKEGYHIWHVIIIFSMCGVLNKTIVVVNSVHLTFNIPLQKLI